MKTCFDGLQNYFKNIKVSKPQDVQKFLRSINFLVDLNLEDDACLIVQSRTDSLAILDFPRTLPSRCGKERE